MRVGPSGRPGGRCVHRARQGSPSPSPWKQTERSVLTLLEYILAPLRLLFAAIVPPPSPGQGWDVSFALLVRSFLFAVGYTLYAVMIGIPRHRLRR